MRTEDGSIIQECIDGEPGAFGVLVDKYKEGIYAFVYTKLQDFQDAQDVTQEVFLRAYRGLRSLRRWESFAFWLYRIAYARCAEWLKLKSKRVDQDFIEDQGPEVVNALSVGSYHADQLSEFVRESLNSLPEIHREVLVLSYFGGMKSSEIAKALGISPAAIRKRLSRARAQLREEMISMMDTAFEGQRLPVGFTIRVVEIVKRIRIQPMPRTAGLPWGISLAAGIIIVVLSIGSNLNLPDIFPAPANPSQTYEAQMAEFGEMPVEMLRMSRIPVSFGRQGNSYGSGFQLPVQQNAALMAPRGEAGVFPEEPSAQLGKGYLGDIAYSPDGEILAATGGLGIWLYDANNLNEIGLIGEEPYSKIAFSPDGKIFAVSDREYGIQLWNVNEQKQIGILGRHTRYIYSIVFSPDGKILASCSYDKTISLWDVQKQKWMGALEGHTDGVGAIAFCPDSKVLASGSWDKTIRLWDIQEQKQTGLLQGHTEAVRAVVFSLDGNMLVSGSNDKTIRLWDIQSQKQIGILEGHTEGMSSIVFSPDSMTLVSGSWDKTIRLWDIQGQKQTGIIEGSTDYASPLVFSPDGKTLASLDYHVIRLWNVQEREQIAAIEGFTDSSYSLAFSNDGKTLASGKHNDAVHLWDVQEQERIGQMNGFRNYWLGSNSVAFSPDGKNIAFINDRDICMFSVKEQKQVGTLKGHTDEVRSIAFSPDGKTLVSGSMDFTVRLWDVEKQKEIAVLRNKSHAHCIAISPDGDTIAAAIGGEGLVRLWDFKTKKEIDILKDPARAVITVSFSPDGKTLASGNAGGLIYLWDYGKNEQIGQLKGDIQLQEDVTWAYTYFSPDGKLLAAIYVEGFALIWDVQKQEQISTIEGHSQVSAVAFSPDGKWLATAGYEGTILLWEVNLTVPGWSVEPTGKLPGTWGGAKKTELLQNYPNPFNPDTWIPYRLLDPADVTIRIYNQSGQSVRTLHMGHKAEGSYLAKSHAAHWDGRNEVGEPMASGVYFYQIEAGEVCQIRKMTVLR